MLSHLKRLLWAIGFAGLLLFASAPVRAQQAVVTHNVNLRSDPSTRKAPIRQLSPPDVVELLEPAKTNGYYRVRTADDEEGWVFGNFLRVLSPSEPEPDSAPAIGGQPVAPAMAPSSSISPDWDKPEPAPTTFHSGGKTCGPSGKGGDTDTNLRKNRTDTPSSYHDVDFGTIAALPFPNPAPPHRHDWSADQLAAIKPYEGVAVRVVGYIVAIKPQTNGSGESTNCHWIKASQVDWHIALTQEAGQGERVAIVVETTPRIRQSHPKWTPARLHPWLNHDVPVRISGWLMLDPEHASHLGKYRSTLWEIHPITMFEVFDNGQWVTLDSLP